MASKITKTVASRIPVDLYDQLKKESESNGVNIKDYLLKIIERRNEINNQTDNQNIKKNQKEKPFTSEKKINKKKLPKTNIIANEIEFPT